MKKILNEHRDIVCEIDVAKNIILNQWASSDDFWWVKIDQRKKDNYGKDYIKPYRWLDGSPRENHIAYAIVSGNTPQEAVQSLLYPTVYINGSFVRLCKNQSKIEPTQEEIGNIKYVCNRFNARAYMCVNKRSLNQTNGYANHLAQNTYNPIQGREFNVAASMPKVHWDKERPWCIIDCDIDDEAIQKELDNFLLTNNVKPIGMYLSHDGKHYVLDNRDAEKLDFSYFEKYRPNDIKRRDNDPMVGVHGDGCMILYSPCGKK